MSTIVERRLWDAFSRSNPYYHTVPRESYRDSGPTERKAYWESGEELVHKLLALAEVDLQPDDRAVEIGSGLGRLTLPLARRCGHVIGVDLSLEMVAAARREAAQASISNVTFMSGDGRSLRGIHSTSANLVFSYFVFQHLSNRSLVRAYIHEMARVLQPGGTAIFQCPTWWLGTMLRQGVRGANRLAYYLIRPKRIAWRFHERIRERAKLRTITTDLAADTARPWNEDDIQTMMLHPARKMKSIHRSRLLLWLRQAGFTDIRIIWPHNTYTGIAARRPAN